MFLLMNVLPRGEIFGVYGNLPEFTGTLNAPESLKFIPVSPKALLNTVEPR